MARSTHVITTCKDNRGRPAGGAAGADGGDADGGYGGGTGPARRRARRKREVTDERQARRK